MRGLRTLQTTGRWLRSRFVHGGLVLLYHRVATAPLDPYQLCVSPKHFRAQMAGLRQWGHPMRLIDLAAAAARGDLPPRAVAVTFDDGYADTLHHALPALLEYGIPATVFVTTGNPGEPFWWDRLCHQLLGGTGLPPRLEFQAGDQIYTWSVKDDSPRRSRQLLREVHAVCRQLPVKTRHAVLQQLEAWSGQEVPEDTRALTEAELKELAAAATISIGAHTVHHPTLATLPGPEQLKELRQSRSTLEALLGQPVTTMSYPFGLSGRDYTPETVGLTREAGYTCACAAHTDVLALGTDPLQAPRFWVNDCCDSQFLRHLQRWA